MGDLLKGVPGDALRSPHLINLLSFASIFQLNSAVNLVFSVFYYSTCCDRCLLPLKYIRLSIHYCLTLSITFLLCYCTKYRP